MNISIYPQSRPIDIDDFAVFDKAFKNNPPLISEFTFTNIYAWRSAYKLTVSLLDNLLIVCSESESRKRFFNPIGRGDIKVAIQKIITGAGGIFFRLPEETRRLFDADAGFIINLDMDNSDYLYNTADLTNLKGKKYDGKRNLIKKFKSTYEYQYVPLDGLNAKECLDFEKTWCSIKDCDNIKGLSNERDAIRDMIDNFSMFNLIGGAIKTDGRIRAMAIAEKLNPNTLVMHVMKADANMIGLYQVMFNEFLLREASFFEYVNLEQDLGIPGLRQSKLSYHPINMVKKYTLELKDKG